MSTPVVEYLDSVESGTRRVVLDHPVLYSQVFVQFQMEILIGNAAPQLHKYEKNTFV